VNNPTHSRLSVVLAVIGTVICGGLVATQSRINGELGRELGDGYLAALLSFTSGFVVVAVIVLVSRRTRAGVARVWRSIRGGTTPWWYAIGGVAGALFVLSQGLTAALLGVALFTVATVTGQTISGLVVDRRGLGTMAPKPITALRLVGAAVAVVAVAIAVAPQAQSGVAPWVLILPLVAGLGLGWQQAVNGQLRQLSGSPLTAVFFNFLAGGIVLALAFVVHLLAGGAPARVDAPPFLYLGGVIGILFIAGYAITVQFTGVLLLGLGAIAGQLAMSLTFDLVLPVAAHPIAWTTIAGTAGTFLAVAIASLPRRRPTSAG
jgi:transporter family-2 protein